MELLNTSQASLAFLILIFILSFSFLILFGFIFLKEINFFKLIIAHAKMFYGQYSVLNLSLNELLINDYLAETEKSLNSSEITSYFNLPTINPDVKNISGFIASKSLLFPLEWKFNFTVEKENQELKNLRIFILK